MPDITTSLQHKQQRLIDLKHPPKSPKSPRSKSKPVRAHSISENDETDILAEPNPTLPLWKRVAKQFWWNEWMQQPLIDAGVSYKSFISSFHSSNFFTIQNPSYSKNLAARLLRPPRNARILPNRHLPRTPRTRRN